jgi:hypothetical protein
MTTAVIESLTNPDLEIVKVIILTAVSGSSMNKEYLPLVLVSVLLLKGEVLTNALSIGVESLFSKILPSSLAVFVSSGFVGEVLQLCSVNPKPAKMVNCKIGLMGTK